MGYCQSSMAYWLHNCSFFFFFFFLAHFIAAVLIVSVSLICDSSIVATCPSIPAARFDFVCVLFVLFLLFVVVFLVSQSRTEGDGWSIAN